MVVFTLWNFHVLWNVHVKSQLWIDRCLGYCDGLLEEMGILQLIGHVYALASSCSFSHGNGRNFSDENQQKISGLPKFEAVLLMNIVLLTVFRYLGSQC